MAKKTATVWQGEGGDWYITIRNRRNKKIVATGAEGYHSRSNALRALRATWGDGYHIKEFHPGSNEFWLIPRCS